MIADSINRDTLYLGGSMGPSGSEQPLIGKYQADILRFAWQHALQIPDSSARMVWNLAETSANNLLATLSETDDS